MLLLASKNQLLCVYCLFLPGVALIWTVSAEVQRYVGNICYEPLRSGWESGWASYINAVFHNLGLIEAPISKVQDGQCDCSVVVTTLRMAAFAGLLCYVRPCRPTLRKTLLLWFFTPFFVYRTSKLSEKSQSDGFLRISSVCSAVMEVGSVLFLGRMLITSLYSLHSRHILDFELVVGKLWRRVRRAVFASWLVAFTAQLVDRLLAAESATTSFAEVMLSTLRHGSWSPAMYVGLCALVSYLSGAVRRLVYLKLARKHQPYDVTDGGLTELLTLTNIRFACYLLDLSSDRVVLFPIAVLAGLITLRHIYIDIMPLLFFDYHIDDFRASIVYLVLNTTAALVLVLLNVTSDYGQFWAASVFTYVYLITNTMSIFIWVCKFALSSFPDERACISIVSSQLSDYCQLNCTR